MPALATPGPAVARDLADRFRRVRAASIRLCDPLEPEDYQLQSMPDASPPKWHLAHTAWFFEQFLLVPHARSYTTFHPQFNYLFNSYYDAVGARHPRFARGLVTRPTVREVVAYRHAVDAAVLDWLSTAGELAPDVRAVVELGLAHEEQHQELLLTDLKHAFAQNPLFPQYRPRPSAPAPAARPARWVAFPGGLVDVGHDGTGFAFDNEAPRHRVYLRPYELADRLVTVGEYRAFMADSGYTRPELWLSDGWAVRQRHGWDMPLYWHPRGEAGQQFTLAGVQPLTDGEPVTHVSFYEADAFARWAGTRLATEPEWEAAAGQALGEPADFPHPWPGVAPQTAPLGQLAGACWQWTASPYTAYPGYAPAAGALGEYNGKFMCNQVILRGGSCATPAGHTRHTYRNFFPPEARWQFTGIRTARDA